MPDDGRITTPMLENWDGVFSKPLAVFAIWPNQHAREP
jgi:hypothetical protein